MIDPPKLPAPSSLGKALGIQGHIKVIDIGANPIDGNPPYAPLLKTGFAKVIGFEPNPEALTRLNEQKSVDETYLPDAIADGKTHTLNLCAASGLTSLLKPNLAVMSAFHGFPEWARIVSTEEIATKRLDDIPETEGADMLKMDVQGGELMVLENATDRLKTAVVIQSEVNFLPLYIDQPLFSDIDVFMRKNGFVFHRFQQMISKTVAPMLINGNPHERCSQFVWGDAIYIKDFTDPARMSEQQLLKLCLILNDCYQSFDIVLRLLMEFDKRTGRKYAEVYARLLSGG